MADDSSFRILGPIMTGPSSSHTAGAVRIGRTARLLFGRQPEKVIVYFHGSFAETWKGHGSDKAVIGGLLGYKTFDSRIKEADKYVEEAGMEVRFKRIDLGPDFHPNSIKIVVEDEQFPVELIGESVGGGDIVIREIMGYKSEITGNLDTIILRHRDFVGTLSKITAAISKYEANIVSLRSKDITRKAESLTIVEIDDDIPKEMEKDLKAINGMQMVRVLPKITEGEEMF